MASSVSNGPLDLTESEALASSIDPDTMESSVESESGLEKDDALSHSDAPVDSLPGIEEELEESQRHLTQLYDGVEDLLNRVTAQHRLDIEHKDALIELKTARVDRLTAEIRQNATLMNQAYAVIHSQRANLVAKTEQVAQTTRRLAKAQATIAAQDSLMAEKIEELAEADESVAELTGELTWQDRRLAHLTNEMDKQLATHKEVVSQKRTKINATLRTVEQLRDEMAQAKIDLATANAKVADQAVDIFAKTGRIAKAEAEVSNLRKEIHPLRKELKRTCKELAEMRVAQTGCVAGADARVADLRKVVDSLSKELEQAREDFAAARAVHALVVASIKLRHKKEKESLSIIKGGLTFLKNAIFDMDGLGLYFWTVIAGAISLLLMCLILP